MASNLFVTRTSKSPYVASRLFIFASVACRFSIVAKVKSAISASSLLVVRLSIAASAAVSLLLIVALSVTKSSISASFAVNLSLIRTVSVIRSSILPFSASSSSVLTLSAIRISTSVISSTISSRSLF